MGGSTTISKLKYLYEFLLAFQAASYNPAICNNLGMRLLNASKRASDPIYRSRLDDLKEFVTRDSQELEPKINEVSFMFHNERYDLQSTMRSSFNKLPSNVQRWLRYGAGT